MQNQKPSSNTIVVKDLYFSYKSQSLFEDLNLELELNQYIGVIGVNGAGKSTFLKLLLGFLKPEAGTIRILGEKPGAFSLKERMSTSLQQIDFPSQIKVKEVIHFICSQYKESFSAEQLMEDFQIKDFAHKNCGSLSGGMMRKVSLACAFAGKPKITILDEPTTGLDAPSRQSLIKTIGDYQKAHQSFVMMISHHPEEISQDVHRYLHIKKQGHYEFIEPEKMQELSQSQKIEFTFQGPLHFTKTLKIHQQDSFYQIISKESDHTLKELHKQTQDYKNLKMSPLNTNEIMEFFL